MKKFIFVSIIVLAAVLRLYRLDTVPPGVNRDEASIGVTAYSLMTTGKDEYGRRFPLSFESFGDWKLPLYIYASIPFVKIFGLSELAVRLPSAIAGTLTVGALYYLAYALFASETIALLAAVSLAISPWHIHISRVESEAIVAVLFTTLGSLLFINGIRERKLGKMIASSILFALTYYTYHGNHVSTSLLLLGLFLVYRSELFKVKRWHIAGLIGATMTIFILAVTMSADHTKISGISIFGDPTVIHTKIELPRLEHDNPNALYARLMHNRLTYAVTTVIQNYLLSYGPDFLFIKGGGNSAHNIRGYGNVHAIEAPFLLLGLVWLFTAFKNKSARYVLWWTGIGAVAAAITKDAPHSNRMLAVVPALAMMTGAGIYQLSTLIPKRFIAIVVLVLIFGYGGGLITYLDRYYVHFPKTEAANWGYAYRELTRVLFTQQNATKNIIMTKPETSPYIYILFYSGYPSYRYQMEAMRYPISADGFTDVSGFGRFSFRAIDWDHDLARKNTLIVADSDEIPESHRNKRVATITLPDGTDTFMVLDTEK